MVASSFKTNVNAVTVCECDVVGTRIGLINLRMPNCSGCLGLVLQGVTIKPFSATMQVGLWREVGLCLVLTKTLELFANFALRKSIGDRAGSWWLAVRWGKGSKQN